jgi:hypothetical protein
MPSRARPICNEQTPVPCRDCADRVPPTAEHKGCHGVCEKYKAYCQEREQIRKERHDANELLSYRVEKSVAIKIKTAKKKRKWGSNRE